MSFLCHICYRTNKRKNRRGNQEWTFQTLATLGTQDTGQDIQIQKTQKMNNTDPTEN